jgi:hypothetical protein
MSKTEMFRCYDEDGNSYLSYVPYGDRNEELTSEQQTTLEQLADLCDQEAESENLHEYVGAHRILAALLHQQQGREQATRIMFAIAELGGLDGMNGVGGKSGAFADFGIQECWADWTLQEDAA